MSQRVTLYSKRIVVRGHEGQAVVRASEDDLFRAISEAVDKGDTDTTIEVSVYIKWDDSEEQKAKQPSWVGSPAFPVWPPEEEKKDDRER